VLRRVWLALAFASISGACASWRPVHSNPAWTLYVKDGERVDVDRFGRALEPAFAAVEARMGTFARRVRVHAWDEADRDGASSPPEGPGPGDLQVIPGIGPARVRAYHVKSNALLFQSSGVFLGTSDVGTAVHELVHARLAEVPVRLPLWFEEGLASLYGDGAYFEGRWVFDGLACWPLRELREMRLGDAELARLLELTASDDYDSRENLLVHFVGWAIVYDIAREAPDESWQEWLERFGRDARGRGALAAARERLERTLGEGTESAWLERLGSEDPGTRFAAAKGLWKLRSTLVIDLLLDALERETHDSVRVAFALNILLATSETRLGRTRWNRVAGVVFPTLREPRLGDERESEAARELYRSMRRWDSRRDRSSQDALADLARFWEE
jgi:hypothetical protein